MRMRVSTGAIVMTAICVSLISFVSFPALGQEGPEGRRHGDHMFQRVDENGDGKISFDEASGNMPGMDRDHFTQLDANGDGFLTREELPRPRREGGQNVRTHQRPRAEHFFGRMDEDGDGKVSYEEFSRVGERMGRERFGRMDADGDGFLTKDEFAEGRRGPHGGGRGPGSGGFEALDADGNGTLSMEEMKARRPHMTQERFDRLDGNGDGAVSREELMQHRPPRHDGRDRPGGEPE